MPRISPALIVKLTPFTAVETPNVVDDEIANVEQRCRRQARRRDSVDRRPAPRRRSPSPAGRRGRPSSSRSPRASCSWCARRVTVRPWRMTVIVSEISITSSSLWVMSTIVSPRSRICRSTCHSSSISGGDSTAVGSSRIRILRAAVQRLENLDALRLAHRQIGDEALRRAPTSPSSRLSVSTSRSARARVELQPASSARGRASRSRRR